MKTKKAVQLEQGDKVLTDNGTPVIIRDVGRGLYVNSVLVEFTNGEWACVANTAEVILNN